MSDACSAPRIWTFGPVAPASALDLVELNEPPRGGDVRGFGQKSGHMNSVRAADQLALLQPKLRIDVLTPDRVGRPGS